jgi:ribosomal protein S18 acetylase RimI-like enzyme
MRTCYVNHDARAIADLVPPGELTQYWTITRINVPEAHRGQGIGSALLEAILADADAGHTTLALEVAPSGGLDHDQLSAWYRRHGFRGARGDYLVRKPR